MKPSPKRMQTCGIISSGKRELSADPESEQPVANLGGKFYDPYRVFDGQGNQQTGNDRPET
jgi:phosphate-selective porin